MLASTPPQGKKRKVDELTPDCPEKKCVSEEAHSTDVKRGRPSTGCPYVRQQKPGQSPEQLLRNWGLDEEFTVHGGSRLGCITCMKYHAWRERHEGADEQKKKRKKKEEEKEKQTEAE